MDARQRRRLVQARYVARMRAQLLYHLGNTCALCGVSDRVSYLEVDHVDGRKGYVASRLSSTARWARYWREYRAGVRLRLLCKECNSGYRPTVASSPAR